MLGGTESINAYKSFATFAVDVLPLAWVTGGSMVKRYGSLHIIKLSYELFFWWSGVHVLLFVVVLCIG